MTVQDVFEGVGAHAAGTMDAASLHELESVACPGAGALRRPVHREHDGDRPRLPGAQPAGAERHSGHGRGKGEAAKAAGALVMDLVRENRLPSQILTHAAFRNAIAAVAATGGSTNAVLHLVAIADELGLELPLEEFDAISEATPVIADLKPVAVSSRPTCHDAGGMPLLARELVRRELIDGSAWSVAGSTLAEVGDAAVEAAGQEVILAASR